MNPSRWIGIGAVLGALGVAAGAFGAHGLEGQLRKQSAASSSAPTEEASPAQTPERKLHTFEVAVRYQMYHALALVLVGLLQRQAPSRAANFAGWAFLLGVLVFSGLLYLLVFTGQRWLGMIVPLGGLSLIAGWVALALAASGASSGDSQR